MTPNENSTSKIDNPFCTLLMPKIIKSDRVSLRQLKPNQKNAQALAASVSENVKHLSEFMTGFCSLSSPQKAFEKLKKANEKPNQCYYFIFHKEQIIGSICVLEDDNERELQYWIDKYYEGSGFVSEAIKAIEKTAFQISKKKLMLMIDPENIRSQRVAIKANFHPIDLQKTEWVKTYEQFVKDQSLPIQTHQKWQGLRNMLHKMGRERS